MHLDVKDLRNFYYRSALGRAAQKAVRDQLLLLWPDTAGQTVAGFGFAVPLLRPYLADSRRLVGLMPAPQGVMAWPAGLPNVSVLCEETAWPIETGHIDRLVVMHGLETSERPSDLLVEAYRALGPGGRAIFVVPHRSGLWSRSDRTPFGYGRPYSTGQLETQLRAHGFSPERHRTTLYQPPSNKRFWRKTGAMWEGLGNIVSPVLAGGVLMVEASKRVHAPNGPRLRETVRRPLGVLSPKPEQAPT
ncbi:class I SAM-dependent methyltransferase [Salinihabitans flavidus]|nr:class I SAM-dependent methyltransferase [Salinihabitans flavidus]